ncbi:MAG: HIT family protein [Bacteroidetes bacterium]|nr:MAG: HIT family protein [Bacteroidota bacterium]MBL1143867.1 HIT family protein [Bacteroidota bacterium]NOG56668.1 HIT family protein [Bacteroidota bacterium]
MGTIFSKIIAGELPCHKIDENEHFLAFLDISPLAKGHTLVIPKKETDYIFDIADQEYADLWVFAKKVAKKIKANIECTRIGVAVIGLEVAHAHIHLVPINRVSDIDFSREKLQLTNDDLAEIAKRINA